jgi:hypothetical protein
MTAPDREREPLPYAWSDVRRMLQQNLRGLLDRLRLQNDLAGHSGQVGGRIYPLNPTRDDRKPGSFVIWTEGDHAGGWKDYALGDDAKGDVIDLIGYIERLQSNMDVYWWALDFLGLDRKGNTSKPRTKAQDRLERERRDADRRAGEAKQASEQAARSRKLKGHWLGLGGIAGTLAETYLREARGIPLDRLGHMPGALRFDPARDHTDEDTGEVTTWPCMVSAMTRGSVFAAIHCTWLAPDGSGKAPVTPAKKMVGPVRGSAIRLASGPTGLSPAMAAKGGHMGPLAIGEGIETGLTVACAWPSYRVWAAGSLSLMDLLDWPECASAVVLLGENDEKPQAAAYFERVEAHWRELAKGRPVAVVRSAVGSDFNDWVKR